MGEFCSSGQNAIESFVSILNISITPETLQGAVDQVCRGKVLDDAKSQFISRVREDSDRYEGSERVLVERTRPYQRARGEMCPQTGTR